MTRLTRRAIAAAPLALAAARAWAAAPPAPAAPPASPWPDATATAAAIRAGQVSAAEVVETAIRRAEALQGTLNLIVNSDFDRALDRAKAGTPAGPFGGVPFLVKDLIDRKGQPTRAGSNATAFAPPSDKQAPNIDAFDRAGLITLGKSATPEFGFLPTTEPLAFGPTHNPWDLTRSPGGSSGGSSVAVAIGVVPVAHATDGGGSIRIPSSHCGLFGLKPSRGRIDDWEGKDSIADVGVEHVVSRSVRDSAALFALTEDKTPRAKFPPVGMVSGPAKKRLRVGVLLENGLGHRPSDEVMAANDAAAKLLSDLGHHVDYTHLPYDGAQFIDDFLLLWAQGAAMTVRRVSAATGRKPDESQFEPFTLSLTQLFARTPQAELPKAFQRLTANALAYDTWFPAHLFDVMLSPVLSTPPPRLGEHSGNIASDVLIPRLREYVGYTPIHNLAGAPAMSLPLYWTKDGLPVGSMFAARAGNERTLFELAYELEQARPWAGRLPPVHA
jgi:amidase